MVLLQHLLVCHSGVDRLIGGWAMECGLTTKRTGLLRILFFACIVWCHSRTEEYQRRLACR